MSVPYTFGTNTYAQSGQIDANFASVVGITGGTMTGPLNGTSATFSGNVSAAGALALGSGVPPPADIAAGSEVITGPITFIGGSTIGQNAYWSSATSGWKYLGNAAATVFNVSGGLQVYSAPSGTAGAAPAFTQTMSLDASGNLTIQGATATKPGSTSWVNPSARDIKQDIKPYGIGKGLQAILALNPVTYRFNEDSGFATDETHIGLVHDETAHMPEMHRKARIGAGPDNEGREVDALDCSAVTWALVNAVKTLAARIEALEKR